jgi:hypothetical protein
MLTDEVKATIRCALLDMREAYHLSGYSKIDMDALDIALAALDEQPQPLDSPDSAGWWAFEGHWATLFPERAVIFHHVYDVYLLTDEQWYFQMGNDGHPVSELTGKWWRISLPWGAPTPPVVAPVGEQPRRWQLLPGDVSDAIAGLIGFACNPDHMNRDSLVMAYTASKWFDAKDTLNEEVK